MEGYMKIDALNALQELCKPDDDSSSDDDEPATAMGKMGPGDILTPASSHTPLGETPKKNPKDIWGADEIPEGAEYDDILDPRPQPEYDLVYKQAVTSEDAFLGMGNKNPTTASCEDMVVKIKLPGTKGADIKLDVKEKFVDCRTPKYKLGLHLPHKVDHKNGRAKWDTDTATLNVTLKLKREYDFMNF